MIISVGEVTLSTQLPPGTSTDVPSLEELNELLKCFPTFIDIESLGSNMNDLFLATQWILLDMDDDLE